MKKLNLLISVCLVSYLCGFDTKLDKQKNQTGINLPAVEWSLPEAIDENGVIDESKMPDSPYAKEVIYGSKILNDTHLYIGPSAKEEKDRYAGNNLSCSSCHASGGVKQFQSGFVGIYSRFPQYNARADRIVTLEERVNGCMERSMNGKKMPYNAPQMRAIITYMQWLSQNTPVGAKTKGQGLDTSLKLLDRAADPIKGKKVYEDNCVACHGEDGAGMQNPDFKTGAYYLYPPIWGNDSYNTGAGMYRVIKAAQYIKHNMPQGNANLTDEEAFDVAAYINIQKRPIKPNREADFPDRRVKAIDMDIGEFADEFSLKQHKFGPYKNMKQ